MVPLTCFEVLEALIVFKLLSEHIVHGVLDFVLELELILFSHLDFYSFSSLFIFVPQNLVFIERLFHIFVLNILEISVIVLFFNARIFLFVFSFKF